MALLSIEHVEQGYGARIAVADLSLTLAAGEIGCLLGPSGCGKTTLLRGIAGFEPLAAGRIRLGGRTLAEPGRELPPEQRGVGMVFQDYALFPHLDVAANIGFGLKGSKPLARTEREHRVATLLDLVGLKDAGRRYPHELSGGQQQRVALARALAPQPQLLLLDEPFSSLDASLRERLALDVRTLLKALGTTAILVTHDQLEAFALADRIGVMHGGRLRQWATPWQVYHRPADRLVAGFVGQGVWLRGERIDDRHVQLPDLGPVPVPDAPAARWLDVLLRPDDFVRDTGSPLRAEVVGRAFRGAECLYTLRLPGGAEVLALLPSQHDHAPGERIGLRLDVDSVTGFAAGG
ncbi:MAG TPA: ABC transporter ATP-binding protein [Plasticicumulans sp.]|nr:ABC transporter ATP-binding protein [Plasticicumulans sp.]